MTRTTRITRWSLLLALALGASACGRGDAAAESEDFLCGTYCNKLKIKTVGPLSVNTTWVPKEGFLRSVLAAPYKLDVQPATVDTPIDGEGATSRETVVALLDGRLEVTDAILQGYLRVTGAADDVSRMFVAIEILLDVSARAPALQALAETLRVAAPAVPATAVSPWEAQSREDEMLARLGLLAEDGGV